MVCTYNAYKVVPRQVKANMIRLKKLQQICNVFCIYLHNGILTPHRQTGLLIEKAEVVKFPQKIACPGILQCWYPKVLFSLSNVRLVDKVARHCDGVLQVLHLVRAARWHKKKTARCEFNTGTVLFFSSQYDKDDWVSLDIKLTNGNLWKWY